MPTKKNTTMRPEGTSELGLMMEAIDSLASILSPTATLREFQDALRVAAGGDAKASAIQGVIAAMVYRAERIRATRAQPILDPPAPLAPPKRWGTVAALSSEDFAQDIIAVLGQPGAPSVDAREVLLRIKQRRRCHKLVVNGRPAALAEVKQMGARLAREGKLALVGDAMAVA